MYYVLDPLVCLGVAAAVTQRVELFTTVLNVGWRNNPILFAKQLASIDLVSQGRPGRPQVVTGRYFDCGPDASTALSEYLAHYYGAAESAAIVADSIHSDERLHTELDMRARSGVDDLILYPARSSLDQVRLLAEALERVGARRAPTFVFTEAADPGREVVGGSGAASRRRLSRVTASPGG